MWAIRELPFTLKINNNRGYLSGEGSRGGGKIVYTDLPRGQQPGPSQKFYVKIPSSIVGIPYLIYSKATDTPLAVGHYTSNPNQKVVLIMTTNSPNDLLLLGILYPQAIIREGTLFKVNRISDKEAMAGGMFSTMLLKYKEAM